MKSVKSILLMLVLGLVLAGCTTKTPTVEPAAEIPKNDAVMEEGTEDTVMDTEDAEVEDAAVTDEESAVEPDEGDDSGLTFELKDGIGTMEKVDGIIKVDPVPPVVEAEPIEVKKIDPIIMEKVGQ